MEELMSTPYLQDAKKVVDSLAADEELAIEGRLILLGMLSDYITEVMKKIEDGLARETGDQSH
jgi:hypothetical protein